MSCHISLVVSLRVSLMLHVAPPASHLHPTPTPHYCFLHSVQHTARLHPRQLCEATPKQRPTGLFSVALQPVKTGAMPPRLPKDVQLDVVVGLASIGLDSRCQHLKSIPELQVSPRGTHVTLHACVPPSATFEELLGQVRGVLRTPLLSAGLPTHMLHQVYYNRKRCHPMATIQNMLGQQTQKGRVCVSVSGRSCAEHPPFFLTNKDVSATADPARTKMCRPQSTLRVNTKLPSNSSDECGSLEGSNNQHNHGQPVPVPLWLRDVSLIAAAANLDLQEFDARHLRLRVLDFGGHQVYRRRHVPAHPPFWAEA